MTGSAVPVVNVVAEGSLTLTNVGTHTIYVGGSGVTASNGAPVPAGQSVPIPTVGNAGQLYATGTAADVLGYFYGTAIT
jgi:outer membrane usher protein FimD/PapC